MDIYDAIGYKLLNETEITDVVGAHVYHGLRPTSGDPCINYFEVSYEPLHNGVVERAHYQISCRASEPNTAQALARKVCALFHNMRETISTFDVQSATVGNKTLLSEPDTNLYHVPVDIYFVFNNATVS